MLSIALYRLINVNDTEIFANLSLTANKLNF
jgi:hypothetical protein